jgi:ATP-binding cassette subfamily C (CFTR/MRP) protein 1
MVKIGGLVTIRAFAIQQRFVNELCDTIDQNVTSFLLVQSSARWLGLALDLVGTVFVFVCLVINLASVSGQGQAASVGLAINYSLLVPIYLAWVVKFFAGDYFNIIFLCETVPKPGAYSTKLFFNNTYFCLNWLMS